MAQRTEAKTNTEIVDRLKDAEAARLAARAAKDAEDQRQGITRSGTVIGWRARDVGPAALRTAKR